MVTLKNMYWLIMLSTVLFTCIPQQEKKDYKNKSAIAINNNAMDLYAASRFSDSNSTKDLHLAVLMLDSAIAMDKQYHQAYLNKASVLFALHSYEEGLKTLKAVVQLRPNLVEAISIQGFVYEKLGKYETAKEYYRKAISTYDGLIQENTNNVSAKTNRSFILLLLEGRDSAIYDINRVLEQHPNDSTIRMVQQFIVNFDRNSFINSF